MAKTITIPTAILIPITFISMSIGYLFANYFPFNRPKIAIEEKVDYFSMGYKQGEANTAFVINDAMDNDRSQEEVRIVRNQLHAYSLSQFYIDEVDR